MKKEIETTKSTKMIKKMRQSDDFLLWSGLPHFAFAVGYAMDYLVAWNCTHIANGEVIRRLRDANERLLRPTPIIVTPEALLPESPGEPQ